MNKLGYLHMIRVQKDPNFCAFFNLMLICLIFPALKSIIAAPSDICPSGPSHVQTWQSTQKILSMVLKVRRESNTFLFFSVGFKTIF